MAIPDYVEKDEGRQSRAFYEHGHIEGSRRYHEQVIHYEKCLCNIQRFFWLKKENFSKKKKK